MNIFSRDLLRALNATSKAISPKALNPINECYYLKSDGESLTVKASDGNLTLCARVACKGEFEACISAKSFFDYVKALPECEVVLDKQENQVTVSWSKGHSSLPCSDISEWVDVTIPREGMTKMKASILKNAILHVINSTGNDELRPVMNGIYVSLGENTELAASDGHICSVVPMESVSGESFIMPKAMASFIKDAESPDDEISLGVNETYVYCSCGSMEAAVRKIDGKYPNYKILFNNKDTYAMNLTVDRKSFLSAIRRVSVCSSKLFKTIRMTLGKTNEIIAQDIDFSISAKENIDGSAYDGTPLEIGFHVDFLTTAFSQMTCDEVTMLFKSPSHAVIIEGDGSETLLMPVLTAE